MIVTPATATGARNAIETVVLPAVATSAVGAPGATAAPASPTPTEAPNTPSALTSAKAATVPTILLRTATSRVEPTWPTRGIDPDVENLER